MKKIIWMISILVGVTSLSGFVLSWVYATTTVKIKEQKAEKLNRALKEVLPEADSFATLLEGKVWAGFKNGEKKGIVFRVFPRGYGGEIEVIVGLGMDEKVKGVSIGDMKETPGLGTKTKSPSFLSQFKGKTKEQIRLRQDGGEIDGITAATISSRAVTDGIRKGIEKYSPYLHAVETPYIRKLLPQASLILPLKGDTILMGIKDTITTGYIVMVKGKGFSGDIPMAVSFDTTFRIVDIWIADEKHGLKETEGFGTKILSPDFKNQFKGKGEEDIDSIDTITGATVSSKGVIDAVKKAFTVLKQSLKKD